MNYHAIFTREGKYFLAEFPDCQGCCTFAESDEQLRQAAKEALEGWLEVSLEDNSVPKPKFTGGVPIRINEELATSIIASWN